MHLPFIRQALRIMRLTAFIILFACAQVAARGYSQTVTLSLHNAPIQQVFKEVFRQTGVSTIYRESLFEHFAPVTLHVKDASLDVVLAICFKDQPFTYEIVKMIIVIKEKPVIRSSELSSHAPNNPTLVRGIVKTSDGSPLAGANVVIKGTKLGSTTDINGEFVLQGMPPGKYTLEVSFMGYETFYVDIAVKEANLDITAILTRALSTLDEIQVIAYGTTTKRLNTGNVGTVKAEDIEKQPVSNPLLALEGRVPGLFITQANGLPGGGVTVHIQGQNSINNGTDPLYVIDGIPYVSQMLRTTTGGTGGVLGSSGFSGGNGNPLNYINPADIESIDVLKDADATAIYGSRAANGAILITTKKGKAGQTKADINLQQGWGQITRKLDLLNTQQYLQMRHEALKNDGISVPSSTDYDINGLWDTTRNTDWQKILIGGTAKNTNINASVSGGNATTQYLVGGTYHRETTVFPGDFADQKGSLHFNFNNVSQNQKFRIQLSGNYLVDNNQLPYADFTGTALQLPSDAPILYNADGTLNWAPNASGSSSWTNPLTPLYNSYQNKTNNLIGNAILGYRILPDLDIKSNFGYINIQTNELQATQWLASKPEYRPFGPLLRAAFYSYSNINSWIIEPQATYSRIIGKAKLDVLVGTTIQQNNSNGLDLQGRGYNSDALLSDIHSAATVNVSSSANSVYKYNAVFSRINYNWQDKYIIDITGRRDGSSRFGSQNQFHNFGSIGAAWIFTQESFVQNNLPFISYGKLRGSYGTTGNDQIGDYQFLNLYNIINPTVPYQGTTGLVTNGLPNPYLQWEETKKLQVGMDLGFLKDRIILTTNYVHNRSSNQLLGYQLPIITGVTSITENFPATIQNTAWEFMVNTTNIKTRSFSWVSSVNLTIPQNKMVAFPNLASSSYASSIIIGQPFGILKKYHFLGVDPTTGKYQFADSHGNPTSSPNPSTDNTVLITTLPKFYGGFLNSFSYKGFQLDIMFQFVKQLGSSNPSFGIAIVPGYAGYNQPVSVLSRWQKPGDISSIQRYNSDLSIYSQFNNLRSSDANYLDASYIRLKNLSLSFQLPGKWRQKVNLQDCRVSVQGQNLLTITKFKGIDPETQSINSLPPLRILTVGLKVGL